MNTWLNDTELSGQIVTLIPMRFHHRESLIEAASERNLWELWYTGVPSPSNVEEHISFALSENEADRVLAFVVIENATRSTSLG
jgi:hypothetical protein